MKLDPDETGRDGRRHDHAGGSTARRWAAGSHSSRRASRTWKRNRCKIRRACMSSACRISEATLSRAAAVLWVCEAADDEYAR